VSVQQLGDDGKQRMDWLMKTIHAVEDMLEAKIDQHDHAASPNDADSHLQELKIGLEELRVMADEIRRQNDELAAERQRYAELFNFAPDAYLLTDVHGVIREANRASLQLLGLTAEPSRKPLPLFVPDEERAAFRRRLTMMAAGVEPMPRHWSGQLAGRGAGPFCVHFSVNAVPDAQGRPKQLCWLIRAEAPPG
jgi:PAS domain S-box-containing protein